MSDPTGPAPLDVRPAKAGLLSRLSFVWLIPPHFPLDCATISFVRIVQPSLALELMRSRRGPPWRIPERWFLVAVGTAGRSLAQQFSLGLAKELL